MIRYQARESEVICLVPASTGSYPKDNVRQRQAIPALESEMGRKQLALFDEVVATTEIEGKVPYHRTKRLALSVEKTKEILKPLERSLNATVKSWPKPNYVNCE